MPLVSGRALADELGITEGGVRKLRATRLAGAVVGSGKSARYDLDRAKALYAANVDPAMQRERPRARPAAAAPTGDSGTIEAGPSLPTTGGPDQNKARAILTTEKALRERIKRRKDEGASIEKAPAVVLVQTLARTMRDGILGFTDKHYTEIAAELGIEDAFLVYQVLDKFQRKYVEKTLSAIKLDVLG